MPLRSLFPRFHEPIPEELYRFSGKVRAFVFGGFGVSAVASGLQTEAFRADPEVYWRVQSFLLPLLLVDVLLAILVWRGPGSLRWRRRATYLGVLLEVGGSLVNLWMLGGVRSHLILIVVIMVLCYRVFFDLATGVLALASFLAGLWVIAGGQIAGWVPVSDLFTDGRYGEPVIAAHHVTDAGTYTIATMVLFLGAHWTLARLHDKQRAVALLRASLALGGTGSVGQHSGRQLAGRYRLGELIGRGGMSEVYLGTDERGGGEVAVKLLLPHLLEDPRMRERFRREAEIAGRLGSPHLVALQEIGDDPAQPYLVMERLVGEDLRARLRRRGRLGCDEVAALSRQLAAGLGAAHAVGVIHRDLKPANVYFARGAEGDGERVVLLDFGISKIHGAATELTQEAALLGTPAFMAPEQARQERDLDERTDIFAAGALLYTAITGRRPFPGDSIPDVLLQICRSDPPAPHRLVPEVPEAVSAVLAVAMAKRRGDRYRDIAAFDRDLQRALAGDADSGIMARARSVETTAAVEAVTATQTEADSG